MTLCHLYRAAQRDASWGERAREKERERKRERACVVRLKAGLMVGLAQGTFLRPRRGRLRLNELSYIHYA